MPGIRSRSRVEIPAPASAISPLLILYWNFLFGNASTKATASIADGKENSAPVCLRHNQYARDGTERAAI